MSSLSVAPPNPESNWDPATVRRITLGLVLTTFVVAAAAAAIPAVGPNRFLLAILLFTLSPPLTLLTQRYSPTDRVLVRQTLISLGWCIGVANLVPETLGATAIIAMAFLAFIAHEDQRLLLLGSAACIAGFVVSGLLHQEPLWVVAVAAFAIFQPVLFFISRLQREREIRVHLGIRHRAEHDGLTGLVNRVGLSVEFAQRPALAVIMVDLDGFKDVNDTLGHEAGDKLLVALSSRLSATIGAENVLARVGGDEFAVAVHVGDPFDVARSVLSACRGRVAIGEVEVSVGASIGLALADSDGGGGDVAEDGHELLRRADLAMFEAKRGGGGVRQWTDRTRSASRDRVTLSGEVERGFERGEFELFFQPIVDIHDGRVLDVEGLLRWHNPDRGLLLPADFLELIEGIGRRSTMDLEVFDQAGAMAARLSRLDIGVSINISAGSLLRPSVPRALDQALRRHDVPPQRITVEVIEDEMVDEQSTARAVLEALGELGVKIAIDDFGTGHSSLSRLRHLPVTSLKIDRSFVMAMLDSGDDLAIVAAVSRLGHALDLVVVAEGVEDMAIRDHMIDENLEVDRLQGYAIARPMPSNELVTWLAERDRTLTRA